MVKTVKKSRELIVCTDDEYESILNSAKDYTIEGVLNALDLLQSTLVAIKGGANARIEVEMAFVKLCEPKLDETIGSVLDRLSAVERAVKNGVAIESKPVQAPEPVSAPIAAAQPEPEKQAPPQQESTETASAPVPEPIDEPPLPEPAPDMREQQYISAPPEPQQTAPAQRESTAAGDVPFLQWGEFMDVLHKEDIALFGVLNGSRGFVRGEDIFLIDSQNATVGEFIKVSTHSRAIKKALYEVTGKKYRLGIFKGREPQNTVKRDPLEDLISQMQGKINIDLK